MSWYLKSRSAPRLAGIWLIAVSLLPLLASQDLPVPISFSTVPLVVPLAALFGLIPLIALAAALNLDDTSAATALRPINHLDAALTVGTALAYATPAALIALWDDTARGDLIIAGRNSMLLVGIGLIARRTLGKTWFSALPTAYLLLCLIAGSATDGQPRAWAWPIAPESSITAAIVAIIALALGGVITCVSQTQRPAS